MVGQFGAKMGRNDPDAFLQDFECFENALLLNYLNVYFCEIWTHQTKTLEKYLKSNYLFDLRFTYCVL